MKYKSRFILVILLLVTGRLPADSLTDNFSNGINSNSWEGYSRNAAGAPWVLATDGMGDLHIRKTADSDNTTAYGQIDYGIRSKFLFEGDFSVTIDFTALTFPLSNRYGYNEIVLCVGGINSGAYFQSIRFTTNNANYSESFGGAVGTEGVAGAILDNALSGKLGLDRRGDTISAWIDHGAGHISLGANSSFSLAEPFKVLIPDFPSKSVQKNKILIV